MMPPKTQAVQEGREMSEKMNLGPGRHGGNVLLDTRYTSLLPETSLWFLKDVLT